MTAYRGLRLGVKSLAAAVMVDNPRLPSHVPLFIFKEYIMKFKNFYSPSEVTDFCDENFVHVVAIISYNNRIVVFYEYDRGV